MLIVGYIFCILNYICYCISKFCKHKRYILSVDLLAKIFMIISLYGFGSLSGAYIFCISVINLIVCNLREYKRWRLRPLYYVFELAYIIITVLTYDGISSILVCFTSSVSLFNVWFMKPQKMRLIDAGNDFVFLLYQLSIGNYAGLLEIFVIASSISAFLKYQKD